MTASGLTLEWTLERRSSMRREKPGGTATGKLPRITRLMALAVKFQDMVDRCEVRDYADLARLGYVTRARMTQLMNLLNLAPDIQEEILFLPATTQGRDAVSERSLRKVTAIVLWSRQRKAYQNLRTGLKLTQ